MKKFWVGLVLASFCLVLFFMLAKNGFLYPVSTGVKISVPYPERMSYLRSKKFLNEEERLELDQYIQEYNLNMLKAIDEYENNKH